MSSNQSEERTIVFTHEKNDTSNQNSQRYVSLYTVKITIFFGGNFYPSNTLDRTLSVDEENCREPAKQQRMGENSFIFNWVFTTKS